MIARDQLHRRFQQTRDSKDWLAYKESRRVVKNTLKNAEKGFIRSEVQSHKDNHGSLWKIVNSGIPFKEKETQVYVKDPELVADEFNQFFSSTGRKTAEAVVRRAADHNINTNEPPTEPLSTRAVYHHEEMFTFAPVTCTQVQRIISAMPSNKSPGPDKISMRVIINCLPVILGPLTDIINNSFITSTFPDA